MLPIEATTINRRQRKRLIQLQRSFRWRVKAGLVSLTLALVATAVPAQATVTQPVDLPVAVPAPQPLTWEPCDGYPERDCATLTVPRDYNNPNGPQEELPVARARATDQANKVGVLVFNPGGPGQPATGTVKQGDLAFTFSQKIVASFDIVTFDPRGTSEADVKCQTAAEREEYWETNRLDSAKRALVLQQERAANLGCLTYSPPLVRHVDTASTVRDLEMLRQAMALPQLNLVGFSYGTFIFERYAKLYPGKVRALVLDAVWDRGVSDEQLFRESILAYDAGWADFKSWCQSTPSCKLKGQNIDAVVNQLLVTARNQGIPAPTSPLSQRPVNDWILLQMLLAATAPGPITYPYAVDMITGAAEGDAWLARYIYDDKTGTPGNYYDGGGDQHRAIVCEDTTWARLLPTNASVTALAAVSKAIAPRFGEANVFSGPAQCVGFPVPPVEPPPLSMKSTSGQPTLVIGATKDRSTPLPWAQRVQARMLHGKLLVRQGTGHISLDKSRCVKAAVETVLIHLSLAVPSSCPTDPDLYPETAAAMGPTAGMGKALTTSEVMLVG